MKLDPEVFSVWDTKLKLSRRLVLFVTLWMSYEAFRWAGAFSYVVVVKADNNLMLAAGVLVAAVTAPISYLQVAVFKSYLEA